MMGLGRTLRFILNHPNNKSRPVSALVRFIKWQIRSRLNDEVVVDWIGSARLAVRRGMTAATANIYCGLREYVDMRFVLDTLQPRDIFVDIGANVGTYSVLAAKLRGVETVAVEPDPQTAEFLRRNILLNGIDDKVQVVEAALGVTEGTIAFTRGLGASNHVSTEDAQARSVPLSTLDNILKDRAPTIIKIDVEGYEFEVFKGAHQTLQSPALIAIISEDKSAEVADLLRAYGFSQRYYDPDTGELGRSPAVHHYMNALFIKDDPVVEASLRTRIKTRPALVPRNGT